MYTFNEIHQRIDSMLKSLGYLWVKDELLYNEIPVTYWVSRDIYLRIQVVERENSVYFDVVKQTGTLPLVDDERWINLFSFSDEYKRRLLLPIEELVKLVPQKIVGCLEQLDASVKKLPTLLKHATDELKRTENHRVSVDLKNQ
jgi:hypothetical protein